MKKLTLFCLFLLAHVASASVIYSFIGTSDFGPPVPPGTFHVYANYAVVHHFGHNGHPSRTNLDL
jgi:hypothetical protein